MFAKRFGHGCDNPPAVIPVHIAVHAVGASCALMSFQAAIVDGKDFGMAFGEPQWRGGRGRAKDNFNSSFAHDVHGPAEPFKIVLAFLAFANAPGELTHANDVDSSSRHQFGVLSPASLGVLGRARVGIDPMFGIIISSEVHRLLGWDLNKTLGGGDKSAMAN